MALVAFAADVTLGLWSRTLVDAAATDAAREIASAPPGGDEDAATHEAIERARATLGRFGSSVQFSVTGTSSVVYVHVRSPALGLLPRVAGGGSVIGGLDRIATARRERS